MSNKLAIFDGNGICYAAGAASQLATKDGRPTSAIHGGLNTMRAAAEVIRPSASVVVWDSPGGADRRRRIYPKYKAHRAPASPEVRKFREELHVQMNTVDEMLRSLGVVTLRAPGYEADDTIAGLEAVNAPDPVVIVSNDKDFAQLVSDRVSLYLPARKVFVNEGNWGSYTREIIKAGRLVTRASWPLFRALCGDESDGIPGVPGIGPKNAAKYVEGCHTVEDLIEKHADAKGKRLQTMLGMANDIRGFMEVMDLRIVREDPELIGLICSRLDVGEPDLKEFMAICRSLELRQIMSHAQGFQRVFHPHKGLRAS